MSEQKKLGLKFEDGKVIAQVDTNQDGEAALTAKLHVSEAIQEAFQKGGAVEGVKVVGFKFELTKLKLQLDSDKDGQPVLDLELDLSEAVDESGLLKMG